ncbi:MAG: NUDIX hydrolase [bacterium]|nr:NUDIX hydrolase [bacterium]
MDFNKFIKDKSITNINININVVALIRRDNKILMGLREYKKGNPLWTFPGGRCEEGETIKEALIREIEEEIGATKFNILRFIGEKLGVHNGDKVYFFECSIKNQEPKLMEPKKFIKWSWISLDNLPPNLIDQNDVKFLKLLL